MYMITIRFKDHTEITVLEKSSEATTIKEGDGGVSAPMIRIGGYGGKTLVLEADVRAIVAQEV
jgi:hypothetical protein